MHVMGKFYLLALSEEAESVGESAVAAAVHPVFVRGAVCCRDIYFIFNVSLFYLVLPSFIRVSAGFKVR